MNCTNILHPNYQRNELNKLKLTIEPNEKNIMLMINIIKDYSPWRLCTELPRLPSRQQRHLLSDARRTTDSYCPLLLQFHRFTRFYFCCFFVICFGSQFVVLKIRDILDLPRYLLSWRWVSKWIRNIISSFDCINLSSQICCG